LINRHSRLHHSDIHQTRYRTQWTGGRWFFSFTLPDDITYSFYATKAGYRETSFDSFPASLEMETPTEAFFKPLYLSNCENDMFISGNIRINQAELIADNQSYSVVYRQGGLDDQ
jgi:hypothetical protein